MEDPSEDVFVALVETENGNFRLREGIYEAAAFHVQRVLNVIATMPAGGVYSRIRRSVEALLRLSDSVVARAGLGDNTLGGELPAEKLSPQIINRLSGLRRLVRFTAEELRELGLSREHLADFEYDIEAVRDIPEDAFFHTALQRRPILFRGDDAYFLVPMANVGQCSQMDQLRFCFSPVLQIGVGSHCRIVPLLCKGSGGRIFVH
jgi:uncharacterized protein YjiS (DUF1127 family)